MTPHRRPYDSGSTTAGSDARRVNALGAALVGIAVLSVVTYRLTGSGWAVIATLAAAACGVVLDHTARRNESRR